MRERMRPATFWFGAFCAAVGVLVMGTLDELRWRHQPVAYTNTTRKNSIVQVRQPWGFGGFDVVARVGEELVRFHIDTGATLVALTPEDAKRIGTSVKYFNVYDEGQMALGKVQVSLAQLSEIRVGPIVVEDVLAVVLPEGAEQNLLGLSFLNRLRSYGYREGVFILER